MLRIFAYFRRLLMVLKNGLIAILWTALLAWSGVAGADEYRPDQFLTLDLYSAMLSPKPLGPPAQFTPGPLDVTIGRTGESAQASAEPRAEPKAEPKAEPRIVTRKTSVAHARAQLPRAAARTRLARRHGNPLDAEAFDTRIQVWPCKSGGICNWKR
jgi:hypothetical protein